VGSASSIKLKSTSGWYADGNGTDDYGFSALPNGYRSSGDGSFFGMDEVGFWWSSTESDGTHAWIRSINWENGPVGRDTHNKKFGFSVRCVKD